MHFEFFPTEIITHVFLSCSTIGDVLSLSTTCHRFQRIYASSRKLGILQAVAESQYGPLEDAIQLVTHNASQAAHITRTVPFSFALLKQLLHAGRIAEKWADTYPFKKWKSNYQDRRLLSTEERYRLRRALYRLWLYSHAFHNSAHSRRQRMDLQLVRRRAELLHNWSTAELAEIADVHAIIRDVVQTNICPSNGTIARKFRKRNPDLEHQLLFNIHLNYPPPPFAAPFPASEFHSPPPPPAAPNPFAAYHHSPSLTTKYAHARFTPSPSHEPGAEGWGDDIAHYYVIEDMMKLDPEQVLWLREHAPLKGMVTAYTRGLGEWFDNNGETWGQTLEWVLRERGEDMADLMEAVVEERWGVVGDE